MTHFFKNASGTLEFLKKNKNTSYFHIYETYLFELKNKKGLSEEKVNKMIKVLKGFSSSSLKDFRTMKPVLEFLQVLLKNTELSKQNMEQIIDICLDPNSKKKKSF